MKKCEICADSNIYRNLESKLAWRQNVKKKKKAQARAYAQPRAYAQARSEFRIY